MIKYNSEKHSMINWALEYIDKQRTIFEDDYEPEPEIEEAADLEERGFGLLGNYIEKGFYVVGSIPVELFDEKNLRVVLPDRTILSESEIKKRFPLKFEDIQSPLVADALNYLNIFKKCKEITDYAIN